MTVAFRRPAPGEVSGVGEIDRTERIETLCVQHGTELEPEDVHMRKAHQERERPPSGGPSRR